MKTTIKNNNSSSVQSLVISSTIFLSTILSCRPMTSPTSSSLNAAADGSTYMASVQLTAASDNSNQVLFQMNMPDSGPENYKITTLTLTQPQLDSLPITSQTLSGLTATSNQLALMPGGFNVAMTAVQGTYSSIACNDQSVAVDFKGTPSLIKCALTLYNGGSNNGGTNNGGTNTPGTINGLTLPPDVQINANAVAGWNLMATVCNDPSQRNNVLVAGADKVLVGCFCGTTGSQIAFNTYAQFYAQNPQLAQSQFQTDCTRAADPSASTLLTQLVAACNTSGKSTFDATQNVCRCNNSDGSSLSIKSFDLKVYEAMPSGAGLSALSTQVTICPVAG